MKDGVGLVNIARGAIIDEVALMKALNNDKVASVGLDMYEQEPHIHWDLKANPHAMLLPHMGTWTVGVSTMFPVVVCRCSIRSFS
jgi:glyoxylate reductase